MTKKSIQKHFFSNDRVNTRNGKSINIPETMPKPERYRSARPKVSGLNYQSRNKKKESQYSEINIQNPNTMFYKTQNMSNNLEKRKFDRHVGKVKFEQSLSQKQGMMLGQSPFVDLSMVKQPMIVHKHNIESGRLGQLQDDFEQSMDKIASARNALIQTKTNKYLSRVKKFSKVTESFESARTDRVN